MAQLSSAAADKLPLSSSLKYFPGQQMTAMSTLILKLTCSISHSIISDDRISNQGQVLNYVRKFVRVEIVYYLLSQNSEMQNY